MRIDVGGHALRYELCGVGETVTLVHGLASSMATWDRHVASLAARFRVLRFDLRGHGGSDSPPGPWTIAEIAEDIGKLLDALGIARTVLVGHSGGGVLALAFALAHQERIASLLVASAASEANERAHLFYEGLAEKAAAHGGRAVLTDLGWSADDSPPEAAGLGHAARAMGTLWRAPMTPRLHELTCPVTFLVGGADFIGPGGSVIMHRAVPGSRLSIVPGRGHAIHLEDPDAFVTAIGEVADEGRTPRRTT
jgi:3-oxoadipate enol-lactonase